MILSDTLSGLAYRFRLIVDGLRKTVPEHQTKNPASCALVGVIWTSLGRRLERFGRILARVAAGIPDPVRRARAFRAGAAREIDAGSGGAGVAGEKPPKPRMPTRAGWLMVMMPWVVAPYGSQLRHWLTDPDAEALVRSSRQLRRLLRPLLRSLSTDKLPECLLEPRAKAGHNPGARATEPAAQVAAGAAVIVATDTAPEARDGAALGAERARLRRASRHGAARRARRAMERDRAAPVLGVAPGAPAASVPFAHPAYQPVAAQSPPLEWWRVQDERRRAALAIARSSVCRA